MGTDGREGIEGRLGIRLIDGERLNEGRAPPVPPERIPPPPIRPPPPPPRRWARTKVGAAISSATINSNHRLGLFIAARPR
ncbi:MAG: hypothetical protein AAFV43_04630 [Planctomycetota bacterium]